MASKEEGYDYGDFYDDDPVGENLMARIEGLATDQLSADTRVANLEEQLTEAKVSLRRISEVALPLLLEEAGLHMSTITTPSGITIKVAEAIRGSIPKGKEEPAFKWLEENNNGKLIKRTFAIEFGKDDEKWANKFERDCAQRKKPLNIKRKKGVHPQTLQAFIRQQLDDGVNIPMDIFGVYRQRFAKVTVK